MKLKIFVHDVKLNVIENFRTLLLLSRKLVLKIRTNSVAFIRSSKDLGIKMLNEIVLLN